MTNYEKIKAMSLEDMADFFNIAITPQSDLWDEFCTEHWTCDGKSCLKCVKEWLESEAEENAKHG